MYMKKNNVNIYANDIPVLYQKEIEAVREMLQFNSKESIQGIYDRAKLRIESGKFEVSEKIVFEAVKKLLEAS